MKVVKRHHKRDEQTQGNKSLSTVLYPESIKFPFPRKHVIPTYYYIVALLIYLNV